MSTRPLVHELHRQGYAVTLATRTRERGEQLLRGLKSPNGTTPVQLLTCDVETDEGLEVAKGAIGSGGVRGVASMLPPPLHPRVARLALDARKHFFTASYVSPEMRELGREAEELGLTMINECGVDPGTDHMSAMRVIDAAHARGGKVTSFVSLCGGLPSPAANTNPMQYKLSWAPRGVLVLVHRIAHFLRDGAEVEESGETLLGQYAQRFNPDVLGLGQLEWHPNGDSRPFVEQYGLKGECTTFIRGSYRYPGWCATQVALLKMGMLALETPAGGTALDGRTMGAIVRSVCLGDENAAVPQDGAAGREDALVAAVADKIGEDANGETMRRLRWLGLFGDDFKTNSSGTKAPIDAVCQLCEAKLQYAPGEADMIAMRHEFRVEYEDGREPETIESTMVEYGETGELGDSAMGRTVSLPLAIAVQLVLDGKFTKTGVQTPVQKELYEPILQLLAERHQIVFHERNL